MTQMSEGTVGLAMLIWSKKDLTDLKSWQIYSTWRKYAAQRPKEVVYS